MAKNYNLVFVDGDKFKAILEKKAKQKEKTSYRELLKEGGIGENALSSARQNFIKYCEREGKEFKDGILAFTSVSYQGVCGLFGLKPETYVLNVDYVFNGWVREPIKKTAKPKAKSAKKSTNKSSIPTSSKELEKKLDTIIELLKGISDSLGVK